MNILSPFIACILTSAVSGLASGAAAQSNALPDVPNQEEIISSEEFDAEMPNLDDPPLESIDEWQATEDAREQAASDQRRTAPVETLPDPPATDPLFDASLPSIDNFDAELPVEPNAPADDIETKAVRYAYRLDGLASQGAMADVYRGIRSRFTDLSELEDRDGRAESGAALNAWARADRQLLLDILASEGFFDATAALIAEPASKEGGSVVMVLKVVPGMRYYLGGIVFDAPLLEPSDLITSNFAPRTGDPIVADVIVGAEANIAVRLPEQGYPFARIGQRDILLDSRLGTGDYTLSVSAGPRSFFGNVVTQGPKVFEADHIAILRRFKTGDLYDSRKVDDLRAALVATGLFSTVSVEPVKSAETSADDTAYADLLVRQEAGPPRTIAATAGYGTGQGLRVEGSWTHRNLFPPQGALIVDGVLGTQEQAVALGFNRANAGRRDRNVALNLSAQHNNFDAFDAYTGRLAGSIAYVSTPIWQKKLTYAFGFELLATYESQYDFVRSVRDKQLYYVAALPVQLGFDTSDDLLNPTSGFRLTARVSPEASLGDGTRIYVRGLLDGSYYQSVGGSLVLAARARVGSISGVSRNALPPSRRYYGGGGGSVRGFGFQHLGPRDPAGNPVGGRSLNEAAAEIRYRFGNFGVVGFVDAGQVYESSLPRFNHWRFGAGIGGRFYTNIGPMRLDVATPINRRTGEPRFTVYVSLGQAF